MAMKKQVKNQISINDIKGVSRRHFVKVAGITALGVSTFGLSDFSGKGVSIIVDPSDPIAGTSQSKWALKEFEESLTSHGITVFKCDKLSAAKAGHLNIVVAGTEYSLARVLIRG